MEKVFKRGRCEVCRTRVVADIIPANSRTILCPGCADGDKPSRSQSSVVGIYYTGCTYIQIPELKDVPKPVSRFAEEEN